MPFGHRATGQGAKDIKVACQLCGQVMSYKAEGRFGGTSPPGRLGFLFCCFVVFVTFSVVVWSLAVIISVVGWSLAVIISARVKALLCLCHTVRTSVVRHKTMRLSVHDFCTMG